MAETDDRTPQHTPGSIDIPRRYTFWRQKPLPACMPFWHHPTTSWIHKGWQRTN